MAYWGLLVEDSERAGELHRHLGVLGLAGDLCADGSFGSRTAHLREPYLGSEAEPGAPLSYGYGYLDVAQIRDHVVACTRAGIQAGGHVIGDAALTTMAEGFSAAAAIVGVEAMRSAKHRWEHVELPDEHVLATMARLGVWASVQPAFDAAWGGADGMYAARLGVDRALAAIPLRSMLDAGIPLAFGSDSPVTPFDPWATIRAALRHHNPAQRLGVEEAFHAHCAAGYELAEVAGGYLRVGGPASYVVWEDPAGGHTPRHRSGLPALDEAQTPAPIAHRTVIRGAVAFERAPIGESR